MCNKPEARNRIFVQTPFSYSTLSLIVVINLLNTFRESACQPVEPTDAQAMTTVTNQSLPPLRYHDHTPIAKQTPKRQCTSIIPLTEEHDQSWKHINETIQKFSDDAIPAMTEIVSDLKSSITEAVDMKNGIINDVVSQLVKFRAMCNDVELPAMCESEQLENYNRRDKCLV